MIPHNIVPGSKRLRSSMGFIPAAVKNEKNRLWHVVLGASLVMTLLTGKWLWVARAGWMLLAILFSVNLRFAFYALFFYASWFYPSGFLSNVLFFDLKHYHLAFFLALTVDAIENNPIQKIKEGAWKSWKLLPVMAVLAIGLLNYLRFDMPAQALRTPANLGLIFLTLFYLWGLYDKLKEEAPEVNSISKAMSFFLAGVTLQVFIAFQNTLAHTLHYNMPLLHNNHIGILCAFSSFYALGLFLYERDPFMKRLWGIDSLLLTGATIASCSRTAWFSFLASFFIFAAVGYRYLPESYRPIVRKRHTVAFMVSVGILTVLLSRLFDMVLNRFRGLPKLLDWNYWLYTLSDYQNFGFLGIFRLQQIYVLKDILLTQPFLGVGFIKQVVDFHGFYFTVLAGTGFTGLAIYAFFCRDMIHGIFEKVKLRQPGEDPACFFLRLSAMAGFIAWLFCSFMETYFVQFSAWITVWLVMVLSETPAALHQSRGYVQE